MFEKATKKRKSTINQSSTKLLKFPKIKFFKHLFHPRNHNQLYLFSVILASIILFIISIAIFRQNDIFAIRRINCAIDDQPCSQSFLNLVSHLYNLNLIHFDSDQYQRHLTNLNPMIEAVQITCVYPYTLNINFLLRKPIAVLIDHQNQAKYVSESGLVFLQADDPNLPHIFTTESVAVGESIASISLNQAITTIILMNKSFLPIKYLDTKTNDQSLHLNLQSGVTVHLSSDKDLAKQVDALQFILQNSKMIEGEQKISSVDMRFDTPVVK